MPVKSLALVVLDVHEADWLIAKACAMASALDAHLTVLHAFRPVFLSGVIGPEPMIYSTIQHWERDESDKIAAMFDTEVKATPVLADFRRHAEPFGAETFFLAAARAADLVIVGTNGTLTRTPDDRSLIERLIRTLGRPVLVLHPDAAFTGLAQRIVIGWSDTREATRAAHDALALAAPGARIELAAIVANPEDVVPGIDSKADFAAALDRLGYGVTIEERHGAPHDRGDALLGAAAAFHADLIAAGAFGHSPIFDFVVGTVTRTLLAGARVPVLLSR